MCIMNTNDRERQIDFSKYDERTKGFNNARSVIGNEAYQMNAQTTIAGNRMWVLELTK